MEREILFRGKRIDNGEWVYGFFWKDLWGNGESCFIFYDGMDIEIAPATRGQYIGLTDKNGVKIFEGDIVEFERCYDVGCYPHWKVETDPVIYRDGYFHPFNSTVDKIRVIGNLHDNPELLEVDTHRKCCRTCEYWAEKYNKCEHPYQTESDSYAYMAPPDKVCELYEETFFEELSPGSQQDTFLMPRYFYRTEDLDGIVGMKWKPSIHMPREAARLFLRVTDVRVERLQEMTDDDFVCDFGVCREAIQAVGRDALAIPFWDSTIKKPADRALYGWAANPWVWVIEFERCGRPTAIRTN